MSVPVERVETAVDDLLRLHCRQWAGRGINKEHLSPRFREHLVRTAGELIGEDRASITEFRVDGELVASNFSLVGKDFAGGYLYGADPELRNRIDTFALVLRQSLKEAGERGLPALSMLRGAEPHKAKWGAAEVANQRVLLARTHRAALYAAATGGKTGAATLLKRHFPQLADSLRRPL